MKGAKIKRMILLKYLFLFVAIVYTFGNIVKAVRGQSINGIQLSFMAIGIVGYLLMTVEFGY